MKANWFEAKVKYVKVGEDGKEKKMSELYVRFCWMQSRRVKCWA